MDETEIELTIEEMAVAVALCQTFRGQRIFDRTTRQMVAALRRGNWVYAGPATAERGEADG